MSVSHIFLALADDLLWLVRFQSRSRIERAARRALPRAAALRRQWLRGRARLYCLLLPAHASASGGRSLANRLADWRYSCQLWGTVVPREMYLNLQLTGSYSQLIAKRITACYC